MTHKEMNWPKQEERNFSKKEIKEKVLWREITVGKQNSSTKSKTIDNSREIVCNSCNAELLSMTKLEEDLFEKVEEVKELQKKVKEVESKEQRLRIYAA